MDTKKKETNTGTYLRMRGERRARTEKASVGYYAYYLDEKTIYTPNHYDIQFTYITNSHVYSWTWNKSFFKKKEKNTYEKLPITGEKKEHLNPWSKKTPNRLNIKTSSLRHIIIKFPKVRDENNILNAAKEK